MISWRKYELPNPARGDREWTPNRLRAAERAVQRERDAVPLFPEMARYKTVEDRKRDIEDQSAEFRARLRAFRAQKWREARRAIRNLPGVTRAGVERYWNESTMPRDPSYLLGIIRSVKRGESAWAWLANRRRLVKPIR